jgi:hypothetical protein
LATSRWTKKCDGKYHYHLYHHQLSTFDPPKHAPSNPLHNAPNTNASRRTRLATGTTKLPFPLPCRRLLVTHPPKFVSYTSMGSRSVREAVIQWLGTASFDLRPWPSAAALLSLSPKSNMDLLIFSKQFFALLLLLLPLLLLPSRKPGSRLPKARLAAFRAS